MRKILHTADWQIGRLYGSFDAEDAAALAEARFAAVERLAALATAQAVDAVVVAGDVFDAQTVSARCIRRLFNALQGYAGPWVMIPGNHDAALAESVWTHAARLGALPPQLHLALVPRCIELPEARLALLCAPLTQRHTYGDLTEWFDSAATPEGWLRIGVAHGAVQGLLAEDIDSANPIAADRAARARLDYLALGDWHGCKRINARCWYSGTPEPDRFKDNDAGQALLVHFDDPGEAPRIAPLPTAQFRWQQWTHRLGVASDLETLIARLAEVGARDVLDLTLSGQLDLAEHGRLQQGLGAAQARVRCLRSDQRDLRLAPTLQDIAALQADGYLGELIHDLRERSTLSGDEARRAQDALALLTGLLIERGARAGQHEPPVLAACLALACGVPDAARRIAMLLSRLSVAELRQFSAPFELAAMQPGLNIFSGANEAGKSTLVRAIRAAFFERHRSTSVDDLRPYGDASAAPTVALDFEIAGVPYRLNKRFLQKKRCELMIGTQRLEGVEAEDVLAELLGFQFALKGASREEHWGVPGLLWIEQGSAQALRHAVLHASDHLRQVLDESLGEVSASGGDELVAQVRKQREELLTGTGKPKAVYAKALDDVAALTQQVHELQQAVAQYRGQVDQLRVSRDEQAVEALEQPWIALREQQAQAQQQLQAAEALADERQRAQDKLQQATGLRDLLLQRLAADELQQQGLAGREAALVAAAARLEQAGVVAEQSVLAETDATERWRVAREALALARQENSRSLLTRQAGDARQRAGELAALLARASAEHARAVRLKREAAPLRIAPADLARLRTQQTRLGELQIRQAAVATRLRFVLDAGVTVTLDGEAISARAERLLVAPATLSLPGIGQLHIAPGGADLAELAQAQAQLSDEQHALLQRLGLPSLAEAEARDKAHAQRLADADAADKARQLLAPQGLEALQGELDAALARQTEAAQALAQLPEPPSVPVPPLDQAERHQDAARQAADAAGRQLLADRQALATAASQHEAARQERETLKAALDDVRRQAELSDRRRDCLAAGAQVSALATDLSAIDTRIAAARPDILRQDVERFKRSADEAERRRQARALALVQLETALAAAGAQGLEEALSRATGELAQAQRRAAELQRRAEALDYLLQLLEQRRQALTRRLQAPLQKHLDRYLQLLFPTGRMDVDDQLVPGALSRSSALGIEVADFETLSFGAREQMGVISRLAYADLLKAAGRPTLIILDDALVHSDEQRLTQMKRVLFDAAQRHQVLLFTCHPALWRDMGVPLRALEAERSAGAGAGAGASASANANASASAGAGAGAGALAQR